MCREKLPLVPWLEGAENVSVNRGQPPRAVPCAKKDPKGPQRNGPLPPSEEDSAGLFRLAAGAGHSPAERRPAEAAARGHSLFFSGSSPDNFFFLATRTPWRLPAQDATRGPLRSPPSLFLASYPGFCWVPHNVIAPGWPVPRRCLDLTLSRNLSCQPMR